MIIEEPENRGVQRAGLCTVQLKSKGISQHAQDKNLYAFGEDLFDKYGSGNGTLSTEYKEKVKEKINAKIAHWQLSPR